MTNPSPGTNPGSTPTQSPSDYVLGDGYNAGNLIAAGSNNKIQESRRCSIINGAGNFILGKYNTHIIGDYVTLEDPDGDANPSIINFKTTFNNTAAGNVVLASNNKYYRAKTSTSTDPADIANASYWELIEILNNAFYVGCLNGLHSYGDVVAYSSSDERLKDNIRIIKEPLSKILSLDSVEFDWNEKQETYKGHDIGLIAQQVEKVAPELVTTRVSGFKAVKYEKLTSLLVGAIKEQQEQISVLNDKVERLLEKFDSMS
tara:strand:- start:897 stop:1676 length:780 start_codon:yes stop_codon:yes gene_type:complete